VSTTSYADCFVIAQAVRWVHSARKLQHALPGPLAISQDSPPCSNRRPKPHRVMSYTSSAPAAPL